MAHRRRGDSDIYQVDLIAALFAGYTIIWIATADKDKILLEQTEIEVATLSLWVEGTIQESGAGSWPYLHRAAPLSILESSCVSGDYDQYVDDGETGWTACDAVQTPLALNFMNDAMSTLEFKYSVSQNEENNHDLQKEEEPCVKNKTTIMSAPPTSYKRILDASLIEITGLTSVFLIGLGYDDRTVDWPAPPFGAKQDLIPRFLKLPTGGLGKYEPAKKAQPFACAYDRDHEFGLQALYFAEEFNREQETISLSVGRAYAPDLYHLWADGKTKSLSLKSTPKGDGSRMDNGQLFVQKDFLIHDPMLSLRFCHHKSADAVCWKARGPLSPGETYILEKE